MNAYSIPYNGNGPICNGTTGQIRLDEAFSQAASRGTRPFARVSCRAEAYGRHRSPSRLGLAATERSDWALWLEMGLRRDGGVDVTFERNSKRRRLVVGGELSKMLSRDGTWFQRPGHQSRRGGLFYLGFEL